MKTLLLILTFALGVQAQQIESKYDRFTDETIVSVQYLHPVRNESESQLAISINLRASYAYKGKSERIAPPVEVLLTFYVSGLSRFNSSTELYVLADGKRSHFARAGEDLGSRSTVNVFVPFKDLEVFLGAKSLEMRLGDVELQFPKNEMETLKQFLPSKLP